MQNLSARRDAFERMRDAATEDYLATTGQTWRPRTGSHTSQTGKLTSAAIDARDFVRARKTQAHLPQGTLVAVAGGKDVSESSRSRRPLRYTRPPTTAHVAENPLRAYPAPLGDAGLPLLRTGPLSLLHGEVGVRQQSARSSRCRPTCGHARHDKPGRRCRRRDTSEVARPGSADAGVAARGRGLEEHTGSGQPGTPGSDSAACQAFGKGNASFPDRHGGLGTGAAPPDEFPCRFVDRGDRRSEGMELEKGPLTIRDETVHTGGTGCPSVRFVYGPFRKLRLQPRLSPFQEWYPDSAAPSRC